jgi:hypothetical protein
LQPRVISIACVQQLGDSHEGNFETLVAGDLPASAGEEFAIHGLGRDLQAALDVQGRARGRGLLAEVLAMVRGFWPGRHRIDLEALSRVRHVFRRGEGPANTRPELLLRGWNMRTHGQDHGD